MSTFSRLLFDTHKRYFKLGQAVRSVLILGASVCENRARADDLTVCAYWNTERQALRLRSPDPIKPWRSVAQGFEDSDALTMVNGYAAALHPERTVLIWQNGEKLRIFINLMDALQQKLQWQELNVRDDYADAATWDPETYSRQEQQDGGRVMSEADRPPMSAAPQATMDAGRTATMSATITTNSKLDGMQQVVVQETQAALWRSAATQVTRTARDLFLTSMKKALPKQGIVLGQIKKVLTSSMGEAAFGYALGMAMEIKTGPGDLRRKRLASELRIGGETTVLNVILNPVREFLTNGIDTILNGIEGLVLPDVPAALPDAQAPVFSSTVQEHATAETRRRV